MFTDNETTIYENENYLFLEMYTLEHQIETGIKSTDNYQDVFDFLSYPTS